MVLINAGSNMHVPSGRITAVDPRGGAAVLGENGVGKTTTLRILPLFFGHLPSQIVASGHGQEPMIRFVIPTDASAVAFEYQRGSDREEDRRLAVIRRRADDHDAPFYRIYRGGFRKDLFVHEGRFLSDEETQLKANDLGIVTTSKLNTAEYRSVILRTPAASKDKARLRAYSLDFSFGPRALDNLDRIVAAMVKKHISFVDIVQVAVGMVQHDLGQGGERAKLTFKQGREPIKRWLANREACGAAFKLLGQFTEMEDDLTDHRQAEARFRALRTDVNALIGAREREQGEVERALKSLIDKRDEEKEAEAKERAKLSAAAGSAAEAATQAKNAYEDAKTTAEFFELERAAHWDGQIDQLPTLKAEARSLQTQIDAAESLSAEATQHYARLADDERNAATIATRKLEQSKEEHRLSLDKVRQAIDASERQQIQEAEDVVQVQREALEAAREPLTEQRGAWLNQQSNPTASAAAVAALEEISSTLQRSTDGLDDVRRTSSDARQRHHDALHEFSAQEKAIDAARAQLEREDAALRQAQARFMPEPGTFLAALRSSPDDTWKRSLAKVVDADLLERGDLDPLLIDEGAASLYGWQVNTLAIATPAWADDEAAQRAVGEAALRQEAASAYVTQQQTRLQQIGGRLRDAELAVQTTSAALTVRTGQVEELKGQQEAARARVEQERQGCVAHAQAELGRLKSRLDDLKAQRQTLDQAHVREIKVVRERHEKDRQSARNRCDGQLQAIDASIGVFDTQLNVALEKLKEQLNEHLSAQGVDTKRLDGLRDQLRDLSTTVAELEDKVSLVHRYRKWKDAGGSTIVDALGAKAARAAEASRDAGGALNSFDAEALQRAQSFKLAYEERDKRLSDIADDLSILKGLDEAFGDYQASGASVIDLNTPAKQLKGRVRSAHEELNSLTTGIERRCGTLRQALTAKPSSVKDLVDATLEQIDSPDPITRAAALFNCYRLIGPQVANDVNMTLKTLLANIGAFSGAIKSFEKEVRHFNERLQRGLSSVKGFERLSSPRLDIVTNFEDLGFYKKLSRMEEIARAHAAEVGRDYSRELPPEETARALGDFMTVLGSDGNVEVNLAQHITLSGSVMENGNLKPFKRASELEHVSSEGLTSIVLITLMTALLNVVRGNDPIAIPWITDEVGKYDPGNFRALMEWLRDNRIDVVTASPELGPVQHAMFARRYLFEDRGRIREYVAKATVGAPA